MVTFLLLLFSQGEKPNGVGFQILPTVLKNTSQKASSNLKLFEIVNANKDIFEITGTFREGSREG